MATVIRHATRTVTIGSVPMGSCHPVVVQSMTNTDTADAASTADQVELLARGEDVQRHRVQRVAGARARPPLGVALRCAVLVELEHLVRVSVVGGHQQRAAQGPDDREQPSELEVHRLDGLVDRIGGVAPTVPKELRVPGIVHVCIEGVESEPLLFLLDEREVACSAASSCASGAQGASHVLSAMGVICLRADTADEVVSTVSAAVTMAVKGGQAVAVLLSQQVVVMSAAPGRVINQIEVPLPFPRRLEMRGTPQFAEVVGRVGRALRQQPT